MATSVLMHCAWLVPPSRVPLLIAVIAAFLIVALALLYFSATVLNRRLLLRVLLGVAILCGAAEVLVLLRFRGPERRPYLAVLPFAPGKASPQAWALTLTLSHNLRLGCRNYYVIPFESLLQAVAMDSCGDRAYAARFCTRSGLDAALTGELVLQGEACTLFCRLWSRGAWEDTTLSASVLEVQSLADAARAWLAPKLHLDQVPSSARGIAWDAQGGRADLLLREGKFEQARIAMGAGRDPVVLSLVCQSYVQQAKELRAVGRPWRDALYQGVATAEELVQRDSSWAQGYLLLAECQILLEDWDRAEVNLRKVLALDPTNSQALIFLSRLHPSRFRDLGFENEEQLYRRAIWYDPCSISARLALVEYLREMGRRAEALQAVNDILRINPVSVQGLLAKGRMLVTWEENEAGFACLEEALRLAPNDPEVLYALGVARYVTEDYEAARVLFERAVAVGDHLDSYLYLGLIARRLGQPEQALHYLQERVRRKRDAQDRLAEIARQNIFQITH